MDGVWEPDFEKLSIVQDETNEEGNVLISLKQLKNVVKVIVADTGIGILRKISSTYLKDFTGAIYQETGEPGGQESGWIISVWKRAILLRIEICLHNVHF